MLNDRCRLSTGLKYTGCWPATSCPEKLRRIDQQQVPAAAVREEQDLDKANGGEYSYLGYPARTQTVRYRPLLDQLPGLLRLVQAAHRLGKAATSPATFKLSTTTLGGQAYHFHTSIQTALLVVGTVHDAVIDARDERPRPVFSLGWTGILQFYVAEMVPKSTPLIIVYSLFKFHSLMEDVVRRTILIDMLLCLVVLWSDANPRLVAVVSLCVFVCFDLAQGLEP